MRTSHEKDSNGEYATLYLQVRDFVKNCIGPEVKEKFSQNITSFFTKEGGFCYLRVKSDYVHIGWFRGRYIDDKYHLLFGNGKSIRGQKVYELEKTSKEAIHY